MWWLYWRYIRLNMHYILSGCRILGNLRHRIVGVNHQQTFFSWGNDIFFLCLSRFSNVGNLEGCCQVPWNNIKRNSTQGETNKVCLNRTCLQMLLLLSLCWSTHTVKILLMIDLLFGVYSWQKRERRRPLLHQVHWHTP